jgi:TetR/AcrR family transcriptional regulator, transcriptional repressor for nem operon
MEFTPAQEKILDAAKVLMLSKGYPATTVDGICKKAKVSKGSFYHFFSSKEDLGVALLEWYYQKESEHMFIGKFNDVKDPTQKMFEFVDHMEKNSKKFWGNGCLLTNLGMEMVETNPKIQTEVSGIFKKLDRRLQKLFAPSTGKKSAKGSPSELTEQFIVMLEGTIVLARIHKDWSIVNRGMKNFKNHLKLLYK